MALLLSFVLMVAHMGPACQLYDAFEDKWLILSFAEARLRRTSIQNRGACSRSGISHGARIPDLGTPIGPNWPQSSRIGSNSPYWSRVGSSCHRGGSGPQRTRLNACFFLVNTKGMDPASGP